MNPTLWSFASTASTFKHVLSTPLNTLSASLIRSTHRGLTCGRVFLRPVNEVFSPLTYICLPLWLRMLDHIKRMSTSFHIKRTWRWKETTGLRKSHQKVTYICLCVSLWSGELQATSPWITHTAVSRGRDTGITWQKTVSVRLLLHEDLTKLLTEIQPNCCWDLDPHKTTRGHRHQGATEMLN